MKHDFSSSIDESLTGRATSENPAVTPEQKVPTPIESKPTVTIENVTEVSMPETDQKGRQDKGLGRNIDGSFKQSNAGRREMPKAKKKVQLPLTLTPTTKEILDNWADTKPRSAANYISEYVEEHLEEIMDYFNK